MMKAKVIGYFPVDFTDQATGNHIIGHSVYLVSDISARGGIGEESNKVFLSNWAHPFIGDCSVEMNLKGKIINLTPAK